MIYRSPMLNYKIIPFTPFPLGVSSTNMLATQSYTFFNTLPNFPHLTDPTALSTIIHLILHLLFLTLSNHAYFDLPIVRLPSIYYSNRSVDVSMPRSMRSARLFFTLNPFIARSFLTRSLFVLPQIFFRYLMLTAFTLLQCLFWHNQVYNKV